MRIRIPTLGVFWVVGNEMAQFPSTYPFKRVHPHRTGQPKKFVQERWIGERDGGVLESVKVNFQHFVGTVYFHSFFALLSLHPFLPATKALVLRVL